MRFDTSHTHKLILSQAVLSIAVDIQRSHVVHLEVACNLDPAFFRAT